MHPVNPNGYTSDSPSTVYDRYASVSPSNEINGPEYIGPSGSSTDHDGLPTCETIMMEGLRQEYKHQAEKFVRRAGREAVFPTRSAGADETSYSQTLDLTTSSVGQSLDYLPHHDNGHGPRRYASSSPAVGLTQ